MKKLEIDLGPLRARVTDAWHRGEGLPGATGLAWLERAHRLAPADQNLRFSLAARRLTEGDAAGAADLFGEMARLFSTPESWSGYAAACLAMGQVGDAAAAVQSALSATAATPSLAQLADRLVGLGGAAGWCGSDGAGGVLGDGPARARTLRLDGTLVRTMSGQTMSGQMGDHLPPAWRQADWLSVEWEGRALLGSPIALASLRRLEGFATRQGNAVGGYAWYPASPGQDPALRVTDGDGRELLAFVATELLETMEGTTPLRRVRAFGFTAPEGATIHVLGEDGRDLLGSPLPAPARVRRKSRRVLTGSGSGPGSGQDLPRKPDPDLPVDVVIPVYRGLRTTLDCVESVLASVAPPHRIWAVDDASPEPALIAALERIAARGRIGLLRTRGPGGRNIGFPGAVNVGLLAAAGRHVVLLNSDTLVTPGWLEALRDAACSAPDIGTATPLSNEASIFSYPRAEGGNPAPDLEATAVLAGLATRANGGCVVDVPTAHGFCMFIRADCLAETGLFDDRSFAQGYGEENDFSERARAAGWRHVAVPGAFVAHRGGVSFGGAGLDLLRRNLAILQRRHPDYAARVDAWIAADPLAGARRNLDAERWIGGAAGRGSVLLITHGGGGGTTRVVAERAEAARARGLSAIVLRPGIGRCEGGRCEVGGHPNLTFAIPEELPALAALLRHARPVGAELHHLLGHDHAITGLMPALGIAYDVWVHDYAWFCARLSFVTGEGRFCGEADTVTCDACVARWGSLLEADPVTPAALRARSAATLRGAGQVVTPCADVAKRVARHVPGLAPVIRAWEAPLAASSSRARSAGAPMARSAEPQVARSAGPHVARSAGPGRRILVAGAIGLEKGFDVLLACARDAASRELDLHFTVVGYTSDDDALLATGRAFITGEFGRGEAAGLIRAQAADLAFLPSIWPETWCYALSDIWAGGLDAAVFDIGAPADRVRAAGRGWVLPLGLPPGRVNDALLKLG